MADFIVSKTTSCFFKLVENGLLVGNSGDAVNEIKALCSKEGLSCILADLEKIHCESIVDELYFMAQCGFVEVKDRLVELLGSDEVEIVIIASVGLFLLNDTLGEKVIVDLKSGTHRLELTPSAERLLQELKKGGQGG